ncbi:MAG: tail fiber domain-containing protein [Cyanobacteriota bacterium]|nr:tail fiber domain-containing protein [Cyanobacteriota bacterium]
MPTTTTKTRQALKARFVRGAIPTEADFGDLISAGFNQADDGLFKLPNEPLSLVRQKPDQPVLRLYDDGSAAGSSWQIGLSSDKAAGLCISNKDGKTSLFLDQASGSVGIGTGSPFARLTVHSDLNVWEIKTKDPLSSLTHGGHLAIRSPSPQLDFIDTDSNEADWAIHVNQGNMWFLRSPWNDQGLILCGDGKVGVGTTTPQAKLHVNGDARFASVIADSLTVAGKKMDGGGSFGDKIKISEEGSVGIGTDSPFACLTVHSDLNVWQFNTKDPLSSLSYRGHLAIRSPSPQLDFIDTDSNVADWAIHVNCGNMWFLRSPWNDQGLILCGDGKVGVGTTTPQAKLHVIGDAQVESLVIGGKWRLGNGAWNDDWLRILKPNPPYATRDDNYLGGLATAFLYCREGTVRGSDIRLKIEDSISALKNTLARVKKLQPVSFSYKTDPHQQMPQLGFIAQSVEEVCPEVVIEGPDGMKAINEGGILAMVVQAIREQQEQIESLKALHKDKQIRQAS